MMFYNLSYYIAVCNCVVEMLNLYLQPYNINIFYIINQIYNYDIFCVHPFNYFTMR